MFVSAWQRTACTAAAAAACTWLSLARRRHLAPPSHCHHPHFLTTHILPVFYIWFISLPSIQKDNGAVKNQACVSPFAAGASLFAKCAHKQKLFLWGGGFPRWPHPRADSVPGGRRWARSGAVAAVNERFAPAARPAQNRAMKSFTASSPVAAAYTLNGSSRSCRPCWLSRLLWRNCLAGLRQPTL